MRLDQHDDDLEARHADGERQRQHEADTDAGDGVLRTSREDEHGDRIAMGAIWPPVMFAPDMVKAKGRTGMR